MIGLGVAAIVNPLYEGAKNVTLGLSLGAAGAAGARIYFGPQAKVTAYNAAWLSLTCASLVADSIATEKTGDGAAGPGLMTQLSDTITKAEGSRQATFGAFLQQAHNWADFEATNRSYELYARYVMPHFSRANAPRAASYQWCGDNRAEFSAKRNAAAKAMFDKHEAEQRATRELADAGPGIARPSRGREAW